MNEYILKVIRTLGGGNHFIELDKDEQGMYYLVVHTGSRNLGIQVAEIYQTLVVKCQSDWALKAGHATTRPLLQFYYAMDDDNTSILD